MDCAYYEDGLCASCTQIETSYSAQLRAKDVAVREQLAGAGVMAYMWDTPFASAESGFRNKAKMVVGGSARRPVLGILRPGGGVQDLVDCPLYNEQMRDYLTRLRAVVATLGLTPYDVARRRGQLKNLLVTQSPAGRFMLRFVLAGRSPVADLRRALPGILASLPETEVMSANLLERHVALTEGDTEIPITDTQLLRMDVGAVPLYLQPGGFFQTNSVVADGLYRTAFKWASEACSGDQGVNVLDLFCGVGGFGLNLAPLAHSVRGIEVSAPAITAARKAAAEAGIQHARFEADDARAALGAHADLVVVNPPRRGIGPQLCEWLGQSGARFILYSSCNPQSLARDLVQMPQFQPVRARTFDMFPHTSHAEVLVMLARKQ